MIKAIVNPKGADQFTIKAIVNPKGDDQFMIRMIATLKLNDRLIGGNWRCVNFEDFGRQ